MQQTDIADSPLRSNTPQGTPLQLAAGTAVMPDQ